MLLLVHVFQTKRKYEEKLELKNIFYLCLPADLTAPFKEEINIEKLNCVGIKMTHIKIVGVRS